MVGDGEGWMSCLADSNLTAIREGRAADLLAGGGGSSALMFGRGGGLGRRCNGSVGVIYATLHT